MPKKVNRSKKLKKTSSRLLGRKRFFVGLLALGLTITGISLIHRFFYWRSITFQNRLIDEAISVENKVIPTRLKIWNMIDAEVKIAPFINNQWVVSNTGATYLGKSAGIGEVGNLIIYGHNRRDSLGEIRVLKGGEKFNLWGSDGREYKYQVTRAIEVDPNDTEWLESGTTHELTMYTCSGFMDSKRFIVKAKLLDEE